MSGGQAFGVQKHGARVPMTAELLDSILSWRPDREGRYREVPKDPKWLEARASFVEQYARLVEFGRTQGFLEHDACFECSGPLVATTDTIDLEWVPA